MGIPLSHLPAPILVLKCSESLCSCIRRLNYVLASTGVGSLKVTYTGFAKTRGVCNILQLQQVRFCCFAPRLKARATKNRPRHNCSKMLLDPGFSYTLFRWPLGQLHRLKLKRNSNDECSYSLSSCILEPKSGLGGEREVYRRRRLLRHSPSLGVLIFLGILTLGVLVFTPSPSKEFYFLSLIPPPLQVYSFSEI